MNAEKADRSEHRKLLALKLYRRGKLVARDPDSSQNDWVEDEEVLAADAAGKLIGTKGFATQFGECPVCSWHNHEHHPDDVVQQCETRALLDALHEKMQPLCRGELKFEELKR